MRSVSEEEGGGWREFEDAEISDVVSGMIGREGVTGGISLDPPGIGAFVAISVRHKVRSLRRRRKRGRE